jgi:hypothetical protein
MHLYCVKSCFSKFQPFECTSIAPGHAFQNASHLNSIQIECISIVSGHAFQNGSHLKLKASLLHQVMLFKMPAI